MARLTLARALPAHLPFFRAVLLRLRRGRRAIVDYFFSSLSRRIVILNLAGLAALLFGILYLNQFRAGLIDARVQSLLTQGEIIAAAIAGNATVDDGAIRLIPARWLAATARIVQGTASACRLASIPNRWRRCCAASSRQRNCAPGSTIMTGRSSLIRVSCSRAAKRSALMPCAPASSQACLIRRGGRCALFRT